MNGTTENNSSKKGNATINYFLADLNQITEKGEPVINAGIAIADDEVEITIPTVFMAESHEIYAPQKGEKVADVIKKAKNNNARVLSEKDAIEEKEKGVNVREVLLKAEKDHEEIEK